MISLNNQIAEVRRELEQRAHVYPRLVERRRISQGIADYQTECMRAVLYTLEQLRLRQPQPVDKVPPG
jgi:hypothetical protein